VKPAYINKNYSSRFSRKPYICNFPKSKNFITIILSFKNFELILRENRKQIFYFSRINRFFFRNYIKFIILNIFIFLLLWFIVLS